MLSAAYALSAAKSGGVAAATSLTDDAGRAVVDEAAGLVDDAAKLQQQRLEALKDWLGEGATKVPDSGSDIMIRSADGTKSIRFDLINSHGDLPHINVETWKPRNLYPGDTRFTRIDNVHIYPTP